MNVLIDWRMKPWMNWRPETYGSADQLMNSYLTPQPLCQRIGTLSVVYLRNSRALLVKEMACALCLNQGALMAKF